MWPRAAPGRLPVATDGWSECPGLLGCVHGGQGCSAKGDFAGPRAWFPGSGRLPPAPHPSRETQRRAWIRNKVLWPGAGSAPREAVGSWGPGARVQTFLDSHHRHAPRPQRPAPGIPASLLSPFPMGGRGLRPTAWRLVLRTEDTPGWGAVNTGSPCCPGGRATSVSEAVERPWRTWSEGRKML